jgi:DNA-binding FrmR family transcriptional regulator
MTHHKTPEISKRMARIEGHVKGIRKILDEGKSYPEIVQQISAVRGSRQCYRGHYSSFSGTLCQSNNC